MSTAKRLVLTLRGRKQSQSQFQSQGDCVGAASRLVASGGTGGYGGTTDLGLGHGHGGSHGQHELDEIAVVSSNADPCHVKYGSGPLGLSTINGPRFVPGVIRSCGGQMSDDMSRSSNTRLDAGSPVLSMAPTRGSSESVHRSHKSMSGTNLIEMVSATFGLPSKRNRQHAFHAPRCISSPHDSISAQMAYETHATNVSSAASELDLSRKARPRHLRSRLKLPTNVALASSGEAPLLGAWQGTAPGSAAGTNPPSSNHLNSTSSCYGTESRYGFRRSDSYHQRFRTGAPNWSFVFDPAGRLCYYWSMVVSLAFLYNFWVIIYRFAFQEINGFSD